MKKLKKLLIPFIVFCALLLVVIVWAITSAVNKKEKVEPRTNFNVLFIDIDEVSQLRVDQPEGKNIIINVSLDDNGVAVGSYAGSDASDNTEYESSSLISYARLLINYAATSEVIAPDNIAEYGLDNPTYTITITSVDGTVNTIRFGGKTYDNNGVYFMVNDDPNVYITAALKETYCGYSAINFLSTHVMDIDYSNINTVQFVRNYRNNPAECCDFTASCQINSETGEPEYLITEPYEIMASPYFDNLVEYIATLDITSYIEIPDEELASYGLDNPTFSFRFVMKTGEIIEIYLSDMKDGFYYGYSSDLDYYFMIAEAQITGLDTPVLTLISSYISNYSASKVTRIICSCGDESFTYDLDVNYGTSISADTSTANLNMRDARVFTSSNRSYAAILFESLVCIDIGGVDVEASPELIDPYMTITFSTRDYVNKTLDFVQRDSMTYYVFINGVYSNFYVYDRELNRDGGQDTFSYGVWPAYLRTVEAINNQVGGIYDIPEA